jgi:hypothetical protein
MCFLKQLVLSRKLSHLFFIIILVYATVSMGAKPGIGASISAGSRFSVGGRLKCAFDNQIIPQPIFSLTGTPLAKKRLYRIGESEYLQLREKSLYFDFGLLEQLPMSRNSGLEAEASCRIVTGWYRGSERKYPAEISPAISAGAYVWTSNFTKTILRAQWYRIKRTDFFVGTLIFEMCAK